MVILAVLAAGPARAGDSGENEARYKVWLTGGGLYWHMVDLLWIFIFSLLYLVGAR
jgi:nitric oxide reductase NorE protein